MMQKSIEDYIVVKEYPTIQITEKMLEIAKKNKYRKVGEMRGNPDYILPTSRFFQGDGKNQTQNVVGNLGDMCFQLFLRQNNIPFTRDGLYLHSGDFFDYLIKGKLYDVKTGQMKLENISVYDLPSTYTCLIANHQLDKRIDYYVHAQINKEMTEGHIIGYISYENALKYQTVQRETMCNPAKSIPFPDLIPIERLTEENNEQISETVS